MGDNGVLLAFAEFTDLRLVTIKTPQGEVAFKLSDVHRQNRHGSSRRGGAERTAARFRSRRTQRR